MICSMSIIIIYFKLYVFSIYSNDLELKETTNSNTGCLFLDFQLFNDEGELKSQVYYDIIDYFNFNIVNY